MAAGSSGLKGVYNMWTVERILSNTIPLRDHLIWLGPHKEGLPSVRHNGKLVSTRGLLMRLLDPREEGRVYRSLCGEERCIAPEHMQSMTRAESNAICGKATPPVYKVTPEMLQRIFASDKSNKALAQELGLHHKTVMRYRKKHKDMINEQQNSQD